MKLVRVLSLTVLVAWLAVGATEKDVFDLKVERVRILHNQSGGLHIDAQGITFRSSDGKTSITIQMQDLREADGLRPSFVTAELAGQAIRTLHLLRTPPLNHKNVPRPIAGPNSEA
jgi:hypothetical protein